MVSFCHKKRNSAIVNLLYEEIKIFCAIKEVFLVSALLNNWADRPGQTM